MYEGPVELAQAHLEATEAMEAIETTTTITTTIITDGDKPTMPMVGTQLQLQFQMHQKQRHSHCFSVEHMTS